MKNLIIVALLGGIVIYGGSKLLLHSKVESGVDQVVLAVSPFVNVQYEGVSSTMSGELSIDNVTAYVKGFDDPIYIDRIGIDTPHYFSLLNLADIAENIQSPDEVIPEYFGFMIEGAHMRVNSDLFRKAYAESVSDVSDEALAADAARCTGKYGFSPRALTDMGINEQVVTISAHFRRSDGEFSVEARSFVESMWNIDANLTLAGDMITELGKGPRFRPRMKNMRIEFEDLSLMERVATYCGRLGLSDEQLMAAQLDKLNYMGEKYGIVFDDYVIEPYKAFVGGKSTLVVTANPREPVTISQISLYRPSDVPALLDLSAEAL